MAKIDVLLHIGSGMRGVVLDLNNKILSGIVQRCRQQKNCEMREAGVTVRRTSCESRIPQSERSQWSWLCALALILSSIAFHSNLAAAATPHSFPRQCGMPGGAACPPPLPIVSPWVWTGYNPNNGGPFFSQSEAGAWYGSLYNSPTY